MEIAGKCVLVTGASEGIGAACVRELQHRGARLALVARRNEPMQALAKETDTVLAGDLCDAAFRGSVVAEAAGRLGGLDIVINNAGIGWYGNTTSARLDTVRRMFELNFFTPLELAQNAIPFLRQRKRGMIVNVSSIGGLMTLPWMTLYSASKFALCSLSDGLRMELRNSGTHVMTVCPGYVLTRFQQNVLGGAPPESVVRARRQAVTAERVARDLADGIEREARTVHSPGSGRWLLALTRWFPAATEARLARMAGVGEERV